MRVLRDPFNRPVTSLRISLTHRCNFRCFFCHMEGEQDCRRELSTTEIEKIVMVASSLGMRKVKLTGGEPLLREDIIEIVRRITPHVDEVSMTSNGFYLEEYAEKLYEAGLKRVNVSLHSLDQQIFEKITGVNAVEKVKKGIKVAVKSGLKPVKINMVVLKGLNDKDIPRMIEFSKNCGAILQLIEFQPIQYGAPYWKKFYYDLSLVEEELKENSKDVLVRELQRRRQYYLRNGGIVEIVKPMHNSSFCMNCTRLRVTADGKLKPCLMRNDNLVDVKPILESHDLKELEKAFEEAVSRREPYWKG
ncbi:GTP 3',8-cyclase MoaA [Candidatus Bathyarchaeota archaeon]|nr:GTP 3',8-cyclase MoaA [Candidatus Bathyarchaeota archaeon]